MDSAIGQKYCHGVVAAVQVQRRAELNARRYTGYCDIGCYAAILIGFEIQGIVNVVF